MANDEIRSLPSAICDLPSSIGDLPFSAAPASVERAATCAVSPLRPMPKSSVFLRPFVVLGLLASVTLGAVTARAAELPFDTVFKGRKQFDSMVAQGDKWKNLPIGQRVAEIGRALTG